MNLETLMLIGFIFLLSLFGIAILLLLRHMEGHRRMWEIQVKVNKNDSEINKGQSSLNEVILERLERLESKVQGR